jgi:hypothetical protein
MVGSESAIKERALGSARRLNAPVCDAAVGFRFCKLLRPVRGEVGRFTGPEIHFEIAEVVLRGTFLERFQNEALETYGISWCQQGLRSFAAGGTP